ncbi:5'-3' exonuclease [Bacillus mangrovi]|uniref:5'-3' exonuclease n=1 Tax=Metabacillus mangrovi TaxID=1491830 RepID=A0A7X2S2B8_9BACI|nr:5'-3' exonuclease [Metabacillus mangrovi]MTH52102.1 5'-3' exonuclease [Metabacillus mangrovi]
MERKTDLLLVDGMALLFRAFFATSVYGNFMINSKGVPTNAVSGFMKHLLMSIDAFKPQQVICCWDMGSKTFRTESFQSYKANRNEPPVELLPQFEMAKEATASLGIPNVGVAGYEADDCIGTIACGHKKDKNITILTGDRDLLQLLDDRVNVVLLQKGMGQYLIYTAELFQEEKGIHPSKLIDVKGLMGDSSDNYPGVRGIGEKTAYKLIQEHLSIDGMLENLHLLTPGQRKKIEEDLEMLHLSRSLAEIHCSVPLEYVLEEADLEIDLKAAQKWLLDTEIRGIDSLIKRAAERSVG